MKTLFYSLVLTSSIVASAAPTKQAPFALLEKTPPYTCQNLLLGAQYGKVANRLGFSFFKKLVGSRYAIHATGLPEIYEKGKEGVLFLPNHSGTIDPLIVVAAIGQDTNVRPVMTQELVKGAAGPLLKKLVGGINAILLPDPSVGGKTGGALVKSVLDEVANAAAHGDNILLYPSGHIQDAALEKVRNKSAVEEILKRNPNIRIVLVRERGIWGSSWTHGAESADPNKKSTTGAVIGRGLWTALKTLTLNGFVLVPKRAVTLEFVEATDFPRAGTRDEMNAYMQKFYRDERVPEHRTFVRQYFWQFWKKKVRIAESDIDYGADGLSGQEVTIELPPIDNKIGLKLLEIANSIFTMEGLTLQTNLQEAGLDSMSQVNLFAAISENFDIELPDDSKYSNLNDLAQIISDEKERTKISGSTIKMQPSIGWKQNPSSNKVVTFETGDTVPERVVKKALLEPNKVIGEDQVRGALTYSRLLVGALAAASVFEKLPGDKLGILLPATSGGPLIYLASHLAGKTPVYVNFTSDPESIVKSLDSTKVQKIVTSRKVFETLAKDYNMADYMDRFVFLEDLATKIKIAAPFAMLKMKLFPKSILKQARRTKNAVVLFTSGSSGTPKAVPLTHANVLSNVNDLSHLFQLRESDRLLSFLPPFHSFGNMTQALSLALGIPAVYHVKPTDAQTIANIIASYKPTLVAGTPSFIEAIAARSRGNEFDSIRLIFAGAEKLKPEQIALLKTAFRNADILEGYGLTETSPVLAVNPPGQAKYGTVGRILPSVTYKIIDVNTRRPVARRQQGILVVRGPSIFPGYLNTNGAQPFVDVDGASYYDTGDIVSEDQDGYITIMGRMGRFRKIKGEMVSLPALEENLSQLMEPLRPTDNDGSKVAGSIFAVESAGDNQPFVLFSTVPVKLDMVQRFQRQNSASSTQMIGEVRMIDEIPMLGTGKTDYKVLQAKLKAEQN